MDKTSTQHSLLNFSGKWRDPKKGIYTSRQFLRLWDPGHPDLTNLPDQPLGQTSMSGTRILAQRPNVYSNS